MRFKIFLAKYLVGKKKVCTFALAKQETPYVFCFSMIKKKRSLKAIP